MKTKRIVILFSVLFLAFSFVTAALAAFDAQTSTQTQPRALRVTTPTTQDAVDLAAPAVPNASHVYTDATGLTDINLYTCPSEATLQIYVPDSFIIADVDVGLNIDHTYREELLIVLEAPDATSTILIENIMPNAHQNYDLRLDDTSGNPHDDGDDDNTAPPYYDRFAMPVNPLAPLIGTNAQGTWTLHVCDTVYNAETGDLNLWTLFFESIEMIGMEGSYKTAPVIASAGAAIDYEIVLRNTGPVASSVAMTDVMPVDTTYVSGSVSANASYNVGLDAVQFMGSIPASSTVTVTFQAITQPGFCGMVHNTALVGESPQRVLSFPLEATTQIVPQVFELWTLDLDNGGFVGGGEWQWGIPDPGFANGPPPLPSGDQVWATNLTGAYADGSTSVLTRTIDLTEFTSNTGLTLEWLEWYDTEYGWDFGSVAINGQELYNFTGSSGGYWDLHALDISQYAGQVIELAFKLTADSINNAAGWYINNISIFAACPSMHFSPINQYAHGCQNTTVQYPFYIENRTDNSDTIDLILTGNVWNTVLSDLSVILPPGGAATTFADVFIPANAGDGDEDTAVIQALGQTSGFSHTAYITTQAGPYWNYMPPLPQGVADGAVIEYGNEIYFIYSDTLKFAPLANAWFGLTPQPQPAIASPTDACLGFSATADPVIAIFPGYNIAGFYHEYNITSDSWAVLSLPPAFPLSGIEGLDIVSDQENNLCYLTGGEDAQGGGALNQLFVYDVAAQTMTELPPMTTPRMLHAAWLYDSHVCVGGGLDNSYTKISSTQCYDPGTGVWLPENSILGGLPYEVAEMADAKTTSSLGTETLWLIGGQTAGSVVTQTAIYWSSDLLAWIPGATLPEGKSMVEAAAHPDGIFLAGGYGEFSADSVYQYTSCQVESQPANADLSIEKYATPNPVTVGDPLTYTILVENANLSISDAFGVQVTDILPYGVMVGSLPPMCTINGQEVNCDLGTMAPGDSTFFDIVVTPTAAGHILNLAEVTSLNPDPHLINNAAVINVLVTETPSTAPFIESVTPNYGNNTENTLISIQGGTFENASVAWLASTALSTTFESSETLLAEIPAGLPSGTYPIFVVNANGENGFLLYAFTVVGTETPQLLGMHPAEGNNTSPVRVSVFGLNFSPGMTLTLSAPVSTTRLHTHPLTNEISLEGVAFVSSALVRATVPISIPAGTYALNAYFPSGTVISLPEAYNALDGATANDLYATDSDFWFSPPYVHQGDTVNVGVNLRRQTGASATVTEPLTVTIGYYLHAPPGITGSKTIVSGTVSAEPNSMVPFTLPWSVSLPPGIYDLFVMIDPHGELPGETNPDNNLISRTLTVLPPSADSTPPEIISFGINESEFSTSLPQVTLNLSATDPGDPALGVAYVLYVEYEFNQAIQDWSPVQFSGWLPFAEASSDYPWGLDPLPGTHHIQAWVADVAGNITPVPGLAQINYLPRQTTIAHDEAHIYRLDLNQGEMYRIYLTSFNGDADVYVWEPNITPGLTDTLVISDTSAEQIKDVRFTASQTTTYQIEIYGHESDTYQLQIIPMGSASRVEIRGVEGHIGGRDTPFIVIEDDPDNDVGLPGTPLAGRLYLPLIVR